MVSVHGARLLVAAALVLALILTLDASPAAGDSRKACRVTNADTGKTYTALQAAVDAAKPGARLIVKGTCVGTTVINKHLVIEGVATRRFGKPKLSGGGKVRILDVRRGRVRLLDLEVARGGANTGAGISVARSPWWEPTRAKVVLRDVLVHRNLSLDGGTIFIGTSGSAVMRGTSRVRHNRSVSGYAVWNEGSLTLNDASTINGNTGWGTVYTMGSMTMNDKSSIRGNVAEAGGGIENDDGATVTMNDSSSISGNSVTGVGGGVLNWAGTFTMNDSSSIVGNTAGVGGGVSTAGTFTMNDSSSIVGNTAEYHGGGLSNPGGGTLIGVSCAPQTLANIYGNTPDDCIFWD